MTMLIDETMLPGWTGRVRVLDYLGQQTLYDSETIRVPLTYKPSYIMVEP